MNGTEIATGKQKDQSSWAKGVLPIADNASSTDTSSRSRFRDISIPEGDNEGQGGNLERDNQSFVEEKVPASEEAQRVINPVSSKADKATRNWHVGIHFSNPIIDHAEDDRVTEIGNQKTRRAALRKTTADTDEEGRSNRTTTSNKLDLTIVKAPVKVTEVGVIQDAATTSRLGLLRTDWAEFIFARGQVGNIHVANSM